MPIGSDKSSCSRRQAGEHGKLRPLVRVAPRRGVVLADGSYEPPGHSHLETAGVVLASA